MRSIKLQIKIILAIVLTGVVFQPCFAIERAGQIGQTWSFPLFLEPNKSFRQATYHFDMAYFLGEQWSAVFSLNTQVQGNKIFYLELGPDFYPTPDTRFQPFIAARLLYAMEPAKDAGWLANLGFELPVAKNYQLENLRIRFNTGGGQFFFDSGSVFFLELARLGLVWSF